MKPLMCAVALLMVGCNGSAPTASDVDYCNAVASATASVRSMRDSGLVTKEDIIKIQTNDSTDSNDPSYGQISMITDRVFDGDLAKPNIGEVVHRVYNECLDLHWPDQTREYRNNSTGALQ